MKRFADSLLLALLLIALSWFISVVRNNVFAQGPVNQSGPQAAQGLPVVVKPAPEPPRWLVDFGPIDTTGKRIVTIVDPESKRIALYSVDLATPTIELKSVRSIHGDLQLTDLNHVLGPSARDVMDAIRGFGNL